MSAGCEGLLSLTVPAGSGTGAKGEYRALLSIASALDNPWVEPPPALARSRLQLHHSVLLLLRVRSVGLLFEIDTDPLALGKELLPVYVWSGRYDESVLNGVTYGMSGIPVLADFVSVLLAYIIDKRGDSFHSYFHISSTLITITKANHRQAEV